MKIKMILPVIVIIALLISKYYSTAQDHGKNVANENEYKTYAMEDMGRVSVEIPSDWVGETYINRQHHLYLKNKMGILVDKAEEHSLVKALQSAPGRFNTNFEVISTVEIRASDYTGIISQCTTDGCETDSIVSVININSDFVVFFGYCYDVVYYSDLIKIFEKVINSIKPDSSEVGYITLGNIGGYRIKLQDSWTQHFENKKYTFTNNDVLAVVQVKLSKYRDLNPALSSVKNEMGFDKLSITEKNIAYKDDYIEVFAEGTGEIKGIKVGAIVRVIHYEYDTVIVVGFIDYKRFYNDFSLNEELIEIIESFSKTKN